jgi:sec-independent protein translocase protein TatA
MSELLVILVIVLLLFGGSRLPGIAAGLGGAVHSFKKALRGSDDERALNAPSDKDRVPAATQDSSKQA